MFSDTVCDLCKKEDDTTQHYLECLVLISKCPELFKNRDVRYEDLFGNVKAQKREVVLFQKILNARS